MLVIMEIMEKVLALMPKMSVRIVQAMMEMILVQIMNQMKTAFPRVKLTT